VFYQKCQDLKNDFESCVVPPIRLTFQLTVIAIMADYVAFTYSIPAVKLECLTLFVTFEKVL